MPPAVTPRPRRFVLLPALAAVIRLAAHVEHPPAPPFPEAAAHAPRPLPDRIVLTWTGDPATTQAVTWRTDPTVAAGRAEIALATDYGRTLRATPVAAVATDFAGNLGAARYHTAEFTGLQPGTLYAYRVGDGVNWSEWFHFRTAAAGPRPFTFVYFGDAQNDIRTHWSRVFREAFRDAPRAAFTLHAGDLINNANHDAQWGEWFGAPGWVNATVPVVPVPGNHEYFADGAGPAHQRRWTTRSGADVDVTTSAAGRQLTARAADGRGATLTLDAAGLITAVDEGFTGLTGFALAEVAGATPAASVLRDRLAQPGVRTLSRHWRPQFALPRHGPAGLEETAYWFDYQGVRVVALNSNEAQEAQVPWLRAVLRDNPSRWTVLAFHHPIFSPARNRDNAWLRECWKPVLDEFKVDLVLTGHDHTYARSGDTTAAPRVGTHNLPAGYQQVYDPAIGTVYVVSVSGTKMYDLTGDTWAVRSAEDTQLYQLVTVDGDELRYEARTATGRLYDAFALRKRAGRPNELVELLPPERRRPAPGTPAP